MSLKQKPAKKPQNSTPEEAEYLSLNPKLRPFSLDGIRATFTKPVAIAPPPPGPAWFGSVMGSGIVATLSISHQDYFHFAHQLGLFFLIIGWLLLVFLTFGFFLRSFKNSQAFFRTITDFHQTPMWGMVAMGYLAVGSATATVGTSWWPAQAQLWWAIDAIMWIVATILGIITAMGFGGLLIKKDIGKPTPVWGLPLVPPMVSATTGAALIPHCPTAYSKLWLMVTTIGCFFLALALGLIVFTVAYHQAWRRTKLPLVASAAAWIPLGIVGQSTAAAQAMAGQAAPMAVPDVRPAIFDIAHVYGFTMLTIGIPLFIWAGYRTITGLAKKMPFTSGWWAMTFPVGTCSLGAHFLGLGANSAFMGYVGFGLYLFLLCTWTLCFTTSGITILQHQISVKA